MSVIERRQTGWNYGDILDAVDTIVPIRRASR